MEPDYDSDPERFLSNQRATELFSRSGDVHEAVAERLEHRHPGGRVLDLGGGNGKLARLLTNPVVLDRAAYVETAPRPAVRGNALDLPFRDGAFDAVAALWMLYHLPDPVACLRAVTRVLKPGGTFVACTSSRYNDPELAGLLPGWGAPSTFDAEDAAALVGEVFEVEEAHCWDAPMVDLPDPAAAELFLRGRGVTGHLDTPVTVTKRGVLVWAQRPRARRTG